MKGRPKQISTYRYHVTVNLLGDVNIGIGEFLYMETDQCMYKLFCSFFNIHLEQYPDQHVVMVWDNAKVHHVKILQPLLHKQEERLTLVFLPPYHRI
ncbi:transposase [Geobacillus stearothermophilus]|uniref:transposase n=1 Tax=Geobacillus stearothermophilus TaxID=1422 RepID=UPI00399CE671